jgi:hypothetical protein
VAIGREGRAVRRLGFFREVRHGDPNGPALLQERGGLRAESRADVVRYLQHSVVLAASGEVVHDVTDEMQPPIGELNILTDGDWAWPSDLAYYVDKYGVALPDEFLAAGTRRDWSLPRLSQADLLRAEEEFLSTS